MAKKHLHIVRCLESFLSLTKLVNEIGSEIKTQILEQKVIESNRIVSHYLKLPIASKVFYVSRLRIIDGEPSTIETSYIPYDLVEGIENADLTNKSLYQFLEDKYNIKINKAKEELIIIKPSKQEKELLKLNDEEKVLMIKGINMDFEDKIVEYSENVAVYDLYIFKG